MVRTSGLAHEVTGWDVDYIANEIPASLAFAYEHLYYVKNGTSHVRAVNKKTGLSKGLESVIHSLHT